MKPLHQTPLLCLVGGPAAALDLMLYLRIPDDDDEDEEVKYEVEDEDEKDVDEDEAAPVDFDEDDVVMEDEKVTEYLDPTVKDEFIPPNEVPQTH